ncbi:FtsX-like permease family protein [uncultured Tessaracoccus sp.]|uniref:FtsX-like permease family protein n=1 Tax=uncultured Tessaracoccus sp. TaxID=905023 RepID=UPI0025D3E145|nr:ABC transporter permease [uncultured Tessaracoccus sp.]
MLRFALTQMRTSLGKLLLAGVAIVLGTGFVAATLLATGVLRTTAEAVVTADLAGAQVVADATDETDPESWSRLGTIPGIAGIDRQQRQGAIIESGGSNRFVQMQTLPTIGPRPETVEGRLPSASGEVALAKEVASALRLHVGSRFRDGEGKVSFVVTGLVGDGLVLLREQPAWVTAETIRAARSVDDNGWDAPDRLLIHLDGTVSADEVAAGVHRLDPSWSVETADQVIEREVRDITGNGQFFMWFGLAFAAVAVVVAAMVIANTFEVLVAQRTKALALLRCGGATKAQVMQSVLVEAAVLGTVASLVGVGLGVLLAAVAAWVLETRVVDVPVPHGFQVEPAMLVVPFLVGLVVTVLAALGPARSATRVSPVAALRPTAVGPVRGGSRLRLVLGVVLSVLGLAMLLTPPILLLTEDDPEQLSMDSLPQLLLTGIAGGMLLVAGFLVLAVFVVPPVVRALGAVARAVAPPRARATVRLATANAVRNPRRTATTTSALVIGVGLVTLMATGAACGRATIDRTLDRFFPADAVISANAGGGLPSELVDAVQGVAGVEHTALGWTGWTGDHSLLVIDTDALAEATHLPRFQLRRGHVGVDPNLVHDVPAQVEIAVPTDNDPDGAVRVTLPTQELPGIGIPTIVDTASFDTSRTLPTADQMLVALDGKDLEQTSQDLRDVVSEHSGDSAASVTMPALERQAVSSIIDTMLAVMIALLGVAVVIALIGVANTLSLSVIERRREHGMLRSVGVTGRQLRGTLAVEGALIALGGAVIGIGLGALTGFAGASVLLGASKDYAFAVDWPVMAACLVVAVLAGLLASVLPSRSAVRVPVVVALATE